MTLMRFAFSIVASIFMRLRMIDASCISRSTSRASRRATFSILNSRNAFRNASWRLRMVSQLRPAWLISRIRRSNNSSSSAIGKP